MPAPSFLKGLPKPILFALYGAVGGLVGALVFAEPLYRLLTPPPPAPVQPEPQVAIAASSNVEVFVHGRNTFPVQIARDAFDGPVTVRFNDLPAGVTIAPFTIPSDKTEGEAVVIGSETAAVTTKQAKAIVEAKPAGKTISAETTVSFKVWDPPRPQADVMFVLDVTASMQWAIDDLKNGIGKFADALGKARIDFRLGLVTFRDVTVPGETVDVILFKNADREEPFTADAITFRNQVGMLKASGGGDIPESSLEGISLATKQKFRDSATKIMLLITDAPPKITKTTMPAAVDAVKKTHIDSVHVVIQRFDTEVYKPLQSAGLDKAEGKYFNLGDVVRGDEGFDGLLDTFSKDVTAAAIAKNPDSKPQIAARAEAPQIGARSLQSGSQVAAGSKAQLVLQSGVWTGAIAALVCLALLAGQHHYLRGSFPAVGGIAVGLLGGLGVGLIGGAAGQGLYTLVGESSNTLGTIVQVLGWSLLGGLAGAGLSLFIPNMKWTLGLAGGAIGGAAGAAGFLAASNAGGDFVGRLVGGLLLGFFIGLMVALVEAAFRRAWLEVRYGREVITVNLGPEPVKVGGDAKACTVWARGAAPIALRFFLRDGKVICDDAVMKRETSVADGFSKDVGNVTVIVRTGTGSTASASAPAAPPPPPSPAASSRRVSADDDFDLPMPVSSPPTAPKPAISTPKPAPAPLSLDDDPPASPPPAPRPAPPAPVAAKPAPPPKPAAPPAPVAAKPAVPSAPPPAPPKPAVPSAPAAKPPAPAAPQAAKPSVPGVPPAAPKPASPAAPAGGKHPDACPGCGRINAGKPRQRYCMVCDNTY